MKKSSFAPGKMILSGEYAVVFGYPGIAVPASMGVGVIWEDTNDAPMKIIFDGLVGEVAYARKIVDLCIQKGASAKGRLTISNHIPVGRGMGSSTALVVAICKCLFGDDKPQAMLIEDTVNLGNSGLDFAVIWANCPVKFKKGTASEPLLFDLGFLKNATLIDTGKPGETTAELVAWMRTRESEVKEHLEAIGRCTERLIAGENPSTVMRDHHRAQVALGVVTPEAQKIITNIEKKGGAAKILGAGSRSGGCGMILSIKE